MIEFPQGVAKDQGWASEHRIQIRLQRTRRVRVFCRIELLILHMYILAFQPTELALAWLTALQRAIPVSADNSILPRNNAQCRDNMLRACPNSSPEPDISKALYFSCRPGIEKNQQDPVLSRSSCRLFFGTRESLRGSVCLRWQHSWCILPRNQCSQ